MRRRSGSAPGRETRKRYLLVACTNLLTYYFLGHLVPGHLRGVRVPQPDRRVATLCNDYARGVSISTETSI